MSLVVPIAGANPGDVTEDKTEDIWHGKRQWYLALVLFLVLEYPQHECLQPSVVTSWGNLLCQACKDGSETEEQGFKVTNCLGAIYNRTLWAHMFSVVNPE